MGKKNKKKSQQNRQAKALKRRTLKKTARKQKPKQKMPQIPGFPGGIPPGMMGMAENMMQFAEPLLTMANPTSMAQIQSVGILMQSFMKAFEEKNLEKRQATLENIRIAYAKQPWAIVDFDELAEQLLKRHIYYLPDSHSEEERRRYSEEELKAAVEIVEEVEETAAPSFQLPDIPVSSSILDKLKTTVAEDFPPLPVFSGKGETISYETPDEQDDEDSEAEIPEAISEEILKPEDMDAAEVPSQLDNREKTGLTKLYGFLKDHYRDADFIEENNPALQKILLFQNQLLEVFELYLLQKGLSKHQAEAHLEGLRPFFGEFLKEYHQSSIFTCDEDQVEEFILDYYIRKVRHSNDGKKYLLSAFKLFFKFAEKMGYFAAADSILERVEEIAEEYEESIR